MRFVHFDQMFHPEFGDQINLLSKFQVKQGHEVIIVTGKNDTIHPRFKDFADNSNMNDKDKIFENETGVKIIRIKVINYISGRAIFKPGYEKVINNLKPDVLFCHYNDSLIGMHYTLKAKKMSFPIVFDSHMLEMASKNKFNSLYRIFYKIFLTPIIKRNELMVIKTQKENYLNEKLGIPYKLTPYISFGTDTDLFKPDEFQRKNFREKLKIGHDEFVIISAGKLNESKGGKILSKALSEKLNTKRKVTIIIIGNLVTNYEKEVKNEFLKSNNNIIFLPTQKYKDLRYYYQIADLSVFPKQSSLSFFDVQACGVPIVAEDNNINLERLSYDNGFLYSKNDYKDLKSKIEEVLHLPKEEYEVISQNAKKYVNEYFDFEDLAKEYTKIMESEYRRFIN